MLILGIIPCSPLEIYFLVFSFSSLSHFQDSFHRLFYNPLFRKGGGIVFIYAISTPYQSRKLSHIPILLNLFMNSESTSVIM
ncbi:Uncharacterised protein [Porphyromonas macacae]|uniref:Uncharacterized protein n=1 Tax=Porphyromonas macacae TaxID=28115 RepID=A0A379DF29_9PORP|nr:Uncharacterised protein [Porphyromonas macacae]